MHHATITLLTVTILAGAGSPALAQVAGPRTTASAAPEGDAPSYFRRSREGWFWYIDPASEPKPAEARPDQAPPAAMSQQDRDLAAFKAFQVDFERALNAATQNASDENVARLLELYAVMRARARTLSDKAEAMAVRMPWLDDTFAGARPTGPGAMLAFDTVRMQDRDQLVREMAQSWGLYFFFRSNCAYCHVQSPLVAQFAQKYGFTILPVSMDGGTLPEYPAPARDNGLAQAVADAMGVPMQYFVTPALVLARPSTREVLPVGFGAINADEIVQRIAMAVRARDNGAGAPAPSQVAALIGSQAGVNATDPNPRKARVLRMAAP